MKNFLSSLIAVIMLLSVFAACSNEKEPGGNGTTAAPKQSTDTQPVTEDTTPETDDPAVAAETVKKLVENTWYYTDDTTAALLTFDGENAAFVYNCFGEDPVALGGKYDATGRTFTLGDKTFNYTIVASSLNLKGEDVTYRLSKLTDSKKADALPRITLQTNSWSGGGMTLTFGKDGAVLTVDGNNVISGGKFTFDAGNVKLEEAAENLALGKDVEASSVSENGKEETNVNDGDEGTRWSSEYADNQYLIIDLGEKKNVGAVTILFETAYTKDFDVLVSPDDGEYTVVASMTDFVGGDKAKATLTFNTVEARYVKLDLKKRATDWGNSIYELCIYEKLPVSAEFTYAVKEDGTVTVEYNGASYTLTAA